MKRPNISEMATRFDFFCGGAGLGAGAEAELDADAADDGDAELGPASKFCTKRARAPRRAES